MNCSSCNASVSDEDDFCPECGAQFVDATGDDSVKNPTDQRGNDLSVTELIDAVPFSKYTAGLLAFVAATAVGLSWYGLFSQNTFALVATVGMFGWLILRFKLHKNTTVIGYTLGLFAFVFVLTPPILVNDPKSAYTSVPGLLQTLGGIIYLLTGTLLLTRKNTQDKIGLSLRSTVFFGLMLYVIGVTAVIYLI